MLSTRANLRRALVAQQGLLGARLSGGTLRALAWIREHGFLPLDGSAYALASGHDLALYNRISGFQLGDFDLALYDGSHLFEHYLHVQGALPASDYSLIHNPEVVRKIAAPGSLGALVLEFLAAEGPATLRDLRAQLGAAARDARRTLGRVVHALYANGAILIRQRDGRQELYDLAERVLPQRQPRVLSVEERLRELARRTLRVLAPVTRPVWSQALNALGSRAKLGLEAMKREKGSLISHLLADREAVLVEVEDPPEWYVVPADWIAAMETPATVAAPRVSFLSDIDPLIWDRQRARDLFRFDFRRPVHLPVEGRRIATLAILYGVSLVGRISCQVSWPTQRLLVHDIAFTDPTVLDDQHFRHAFAAAVEGLAGFHEARAIEAAGPLPPRLLP